MEPIGGVLGESGFWVKVRTGREYTIGQVVTSTYRSLELLVGSIRIIGDNIPCCVGNCRCVVSGGDW